MGIAARADQHVHAHALATDLADQIAQDAETGHGFQRCLRLRLRRWCGHAQADGERCHCQDAVDTGWQGRAGVDRHGNSFRR